MIVLVFDVYTLICLDNGLVTLTDMVVLQGSIYGIVISSIFVNYAQENVVS